MPPLHLRQTLTTSTPSSLAAATTSGVSFLTVAGATSGSAMCPSAFLRKKNDWPARGSGRARALSPRAVFVRVSEVRDCVCLGCVIVYVHDV